MKGVFKSFAPETQELQVNFSLEYKKPRWKAKSLNVENVRYGLKHQKLVSKIKKGVIFGLKEVVL